MLRLRITKLHIVFLQNPEYLGLSGPIALTSGTALVVIACENLHHNIEQNCPFDSAILNRMSRTPTYKMNNGCCQLHNMHVRVTSGVRTWFIRGWSSNLMFSISILPCLKLLVMEKAMKCVSQDVWDIYSSKGRLVKASSSDSVRGALRALCADGRKTSWR